MKLLRPMAIALALTLVTGTIATAQTTDTGVVVPTVDELNALADEVDAVGGRVDFLERDLLDRIEALEARIAELDGETDGRPDGPDPDDPDGSDGSGDPGDDDQRDGGPPAADGGDYLAIAADDLAALPTSGDAWEQVVDAANQSITPDLADQNDPDAAYAFAAGLVYARTGDASYKAKVEDALAQLPGTSFGGNAVLSLGRQLGGYVLAADLVGYDDARFNAWLDGIRSEDIGGHSRWDSLEGTFKDTGTNWGTFAGSSYIAASLFLGDDDAVADAADVFRGWAGDRSAHEFRLSSGGNKVHGSWACNGGDWTPVNDCRGDARDGAPWEDAGRDGNHPDVHPNYTGQGMQGSVMSALLLDRAGYEPFDGYTRSTMCRIGDFVDRSGVSTEWSSGNPWTLSVIDHFCGTDHRQADGRGYGRQFGFANWLFFS